MKSFREDWKSRRERRSYCWPHSNRNDVGEVYVSGEGFVHACTRCNQCFSCKDDLLVHMLSSHRQQGSESVVTGEPSLQRRPTGGGRHVCDECQARFSREDDLGVHKLTAHYKDERTPVPPYGHFSFDTVKTPPFSVITSPERMGNFRGIQGENNSCYLDASLVALFYADDTFDSLLHSPINDNRSLSHPLEYARTYMTLHIVNNLRARGFVPSMLVFEWRRMIASSFGSDHNFDAHCQEEEACEFVRFLVETFGAADESLRFVAQHQSVIKSETTSKRRASTDSSQGSEAPQGEVMLQLLAPSYQNPDPFGAWTTEQLLNDTMSTEKLVFTDLRRSLILQLPRYGKRDRVIDSVVPSPTLYACTSGGTNCKKVQYQLRSLLVIGTSHFVAYLRVPCTEAIGSDKNDMNAGPKFSWLYFDSMSDRVSEQNIPLIEDATYQMQVLEAPNAPTLVQNEMERPEREHLRRVVNDLSVAIYKCVDEQYVEETEVVLNDNLQGTWQEGNVVVTNGLFREKRGSGRV